ncbi:hypothetical protein B0H16DRAFT_1464266 [Mycena metata]|uniref:Uncharacterized protein n=1 Tax=Mycena metata TaxID=1033252 RepID=A0AAD7N1R8_9AGAR|nr:hypothetical protein B0H16DRAFT_1464266 [Mycena metata]
MPHQPTITEVRLNNISTCVAITTSTLNILVDSLKISGLEAILNTTQSVLKLLKTVKHEKNECADLMEHTHNLLNAIIDAYVKSDTGIELPPSALNQIANFTHTLHKIHTFVEAHQRGSRVKKSFRQGELSGLLKDCKTGLEQGLRFFQIESLNLMSAVWEMEKQAQIRYREVLSMIETMSSSDSASSAYDHWTKASFTVRLFGGQGLWTIPHPTTLIAQTLGWLKALDDPKLEKLDIPMALGFCHMAISLARSHGNITGESAALARLAWIKWLTADHSARIYAQAAQRLAKVSGNLANEAEGLYLEALCWRGSGDYRKCISLLRRASALLELCGLSRGALDYSLMDCRAAVHAFKSEYAQACNLHRQLLQTSQERQLSHHGYSWINIAAVEVLMGVSDEVIQEKIGASQTICNKIESKIMMIACDVVQADLNLREGDISCSLFCKCLKSGLGQFSEIVTHCLERLADVTRWSPHHDPSWSIVFLANSVKSKEKLAIHKALQFIGDVHFIENDEVTAVSLFTVALEGFTSMDVHRSRAECMIRLGDIAKESGNSLKALELWENAKPLFERSSQTKRVQDIDERVGGISEELKEQHRENLARLVELNVPAGKVEGADSDIEELE